MNTFEDLLPGEYYYDAVLWAKEKGIVNGINEFCFDANEEMTREQFVASPAKPIVSNKFQYFPGNTLLYKLL